MDDNLKLFENPDFGDVRVLLDEKNNPWFVGNDIARCLGYENLGNAVKRFVDDEDSIILTSDCKSMGFKINPLINQAVREIKLINESGMYSLIMSSKMESAKKFKRWVTSEVLPSIRKTGSYSMPSNNMPSKNELPSDYIEALEALLKSEKEKRALAEAKKAAEEAKRISDNIIKEQAPMVEFAKTAEIAQETDMLIREVREKLEAHGYDIAEKNLRILLEDKKFFAKTGKRWLLSQRMIDSGYARYRYRNDDEFYGTNTVYVTPKGFQWIVSKISKEWMPRFLELKGRVLSRSDKDIFAKR
ncbi:MAG: antirepressor protein KilAC domain [Bacteriophage sp.]|jgi:prophage antirepressor-like protein|nr:MAG: antirepressor protein KilAC domain protein [Bacteriophage sp.]UWD72455.1 MAG: antirepressor protein KilAC domain [Bacteriophage sp.]UWG72270.1 MAG: antirepressor protein KilAC domain [Bacteriophage sp.]